MSSIIGKYMGPLFVVEAPSGAINGSNVTFTLSETPAANSAVKLTLDGIELVPTTHFTLSGTTITMADAPSLGQNLQASYIKA